MCNEMPDAHNNGYLGDEVSVDAQDQLQSLRLLKQLSHRSWGFVHTAYAFVLGL